MKGGNQNNSWGGQGDFHRTSTWKMKVETSQKEATKRILEEEGGLEKFLVEKEKEGEIEHCVGYFYVPMKLGH